MRVARPQVAGDLLRAPPLRQQLTDQPPQCGVVSTRADDRGPGGRRLAVGVERAVAAVAAAVAAQLTGDRRGRPADLLGDLPDAQPGVVQIGDLDAFVLDR